MPYEVEEERKENSVSGRERERKSKECKRTRKNGSEAVSCVERETKNVEKVYKTRSASVRNTNPRHEQKISDCVIILCSNR